MSTNKATDEIIHVDEISAVLWELDPMRTGCSGDEAMRDEYEFQAEESASLTENGTPLRTAVVEVFDKWFWEDCLTSASDTSRLNTIVENIQKSVADFPTNSIAVKT